jgi:hypothetical protein
MNDDDVNEKKGGAGLFSFCGDASEDFFKIAKLNFKV